MYLKTQTAPGNAYICSFSFQIYEARLVINTEYTGLKYLIHHYPITTAFGAITSNLIVILVVFGFFRAVGTGVPLLR